MITQPFERTISEKEGRLAPIFFAPETMYETCDLYDQSSQFHERHQEIIDQRYNHGIVSSLETEFGHETITFDASRLAEDGHYVWEVCYGNGGALEAIRFEAGEAMLRGDYIRTSVQGAIVEFWPLSNDAVELAKDKLLERLASSEVDERIDEIYIRRQSIISDLGELAVEQKAEILKWGSESQFKAHEIEVKESQLAQAGLTAVLIFDEHRLRRYQKP